MQNQRVGVCSDGLRMVSGAQQSVLFRSGKVIVQFHFHSHGRLPASYCDRDGRESYLQDPGQADVLLSALLAGAFMGLSGLGTFPAC